MIRLMFEILFAITRFVFSLALWPFTILFGGKKHKTKKNKNKELDSADAMILGLTLFDDFDDY